jgi:hypothetical protein
VSCAYHPGVTRIHIIISECAMYVVMSLQNVHETLLYRTVCVIVCMLPRYETMLSLVELLQRTCMYVCAYIHVCVGIYMCVCVCTCTHIFTHSYNPHMHYFRFTNICVNRHVCLSSARNLPGIVIDA